MVATNWTDTSAKVRNTCDLVKRNTCDLIKRNTNNLVQLWLRKESYWHEITHKCTSHVSRISSKTFIFGWSIVEKQVVYLMRKITKVIQFNFSLQLFIYEKKKNTSTETSKIPRYFVVLIERMFKGASLNRKEELINKQGALDYLNGQQKLARTVLTSR